MEIAAAKTPAIIATTIGAVKKLKLEPPLSAFEHFPSHNNILSSYCTFNIPENPINAIAIKPIVISVIPGPLKPAGTGAFISFF